MSVLAPVWLLALLPWIAAALWLLLGRRRRQWVPYLRFWRGPVRSPRLPQAIEKPPLYLLLALAGILAAILAAAQPIIRSRRLGNRPPINIVVDCGATMSIQDQGRPRFASLAGAAQDAILHTLGSGVVRLRSVPQNDTLLSDGGQWARAAGQLQPTGRNTRDNLRQTVASILDREDGPVIVLSDQDIGLDSPRLLRLCPLDAVDHVGIVKLSARDGPHPEAMVRLRNDSDRTTAQLSLRSQTSATQPAAFEALPLEPVALGPRGSERNYFVPITMGKIIEAILAENPVVADQHAWVVRQMISPRLEPHFALPETLQRMVDIYQAAHPARPDSPPVALVENFADLPTGQAGIAIAQPRDGEPVAGEVVLAQHPITQNLKESDVAKMRLSNASPTAPGWEAIVTIAGRPAVMVRSQQRRQVWVGISSPNWGQTTAYVVFWTNVLDWISPVKDEFASYPLTSWQMEYQPYQPQNITAGLWPGVYQADSSEYRAFNTLDLRLQSTSRASWDRGLNLLAASQKRGIEMAQGLLIAALACLALAALTWRKRDD